MPSVLENFDSKSLNPGDAYPPPSADKVRIINMRYCPFGERGVIALALKEVPSDVVNVNLKKKPDWFLELNPIGKVPTIQVGKTTLYESGPIVEWVDAAYPKGAAIQKADATDRCLDKMFVERLGTMSVYTAMRDTSPTAADPVKAALKLVAEKLGDNQYLAGNEFGYLDVMVYPMVERVLCLDAIRPMGLIEWIKATYPAVMAYDSRVRAHPLVGKCVRSVEKHAAFIHSMAAATDGVPDYDI
jgi:glutathione S-transferase